MRERSALATKHFPEGMPLFVSRTMGLASFRLGETLAADFELRQQCTNSGSKLYSSQRSRATAVR